MKLLNLLPLVMLLFTGCDWTHGSFTAQAPAKSLVEARKGFKTQIEQLDADDKPSAPAPPVELFRLVDFDSAVGKFGAYLTPDPQDGQKHPAIIWITGGDCNTIGESCWNDASPEDDQSASAYRKAGLIMMFPSLRGGNDNQGVREAFFGEVDDVLAAADFLSQQSYVDADRIYLGGHSTGGTLVLLVSEYSDRFRAVFSFGPADNVEGYGPGFLPYDLNDPRESELRSPIRWLASIKSPTFVFEGTEGANLSALLAMSQSSTNPQAHFLTVRGASHFGILAPTNRLIAEKILQDIGPTCNLKFSEGEVSKLLGK